MLREPQPAQQRLTLGYEQRQKSRLRTKLDSGEEAGLFLPRGTILRSGDLLVTEAGVVVEVCAASESVCTVRTDNPTLLARASYHLGNRHVALQVGDGWLRFHTDHVLGNMVEGMGLAVVHEQAAFEPEPGAYHGHHHHD